MRMTIMVQRPCLAALAGALIAGPAEAYIGPGAGVGTIVVAAALVLGLLLLLFGFVWYPLKRMMKKRKADGVQDRAE